MIDVNWLMEQGPCMKFYAGNTIPVPTSITGDQKSMYILLTGAVDVYGRSPSGEMMKKSAVVPGDLFCAREYFYGQSGHVYHAVEDCIVYLLTKDTFADLSWSQPDILFEILRSAYAPQQSPIPAAPPPSPATQARPVPVAPARPAPPAAPAPAAPPPSAPPPPKAAAPAPPPKAPAPPPAKDTAPASDNMLKKHKHKKPIETIYFPGHKSYKDKDLPYNEKLAYPKEYKCPSCRKQFMGYRVFGTKLQEDDERPIRFDLRKFYKDFRIEWFDIITCTHCYFSAFYNFFDDIKPVKTSAIEDKLAAVHGGADVDFSAPRDIDTAFTMHYLALICTDGFPTQSRQLCAKVLGNLSWLYEDAGDKKMEVKVANLAAEAYETLFSSGNMTPTQEQVTCLSIAGMQHRAGVDRDLARYLYTAKTNDMGDKKYAELAAQFMDELKINDESLEKMTR